MPTEIEVKLRVAGHGPTRTRLQELHAEPHGSATEHAIYFDSPQRTLLAADSGLRVRSSIYTDGRKPKHVITFKGPRHSAGMKSRDETELVVDDFDTAVSLLKCLGFEPNLEFEKCRDSWQIDRCKVELDELPGVGTFVEVEGPDEQAVNAVREKLNLRDAEEVQESYAKIMSQRR